MNHERTAMIDRYLTGRMSHDEHARFAAEMARDRSLQAMVEAEELIRGTIHRDLAAISLDHSATQAHVMGSLAAFTSSAGVGVGTGGAAAINTAGGGFRRLLLNTSGSVTKGIMIAGVGAGLGLGGYFMLGTEGPPESDTVPAVAAPAAPATTLPATTAPTRVEPPPAPEAQETQPVESARALEIRTDAVDRQKHPIEVESTEKEARSHGGGRQGERSEQESRRAERRTTEPAPEKSAPLPVSDDENRPLPVVKKQTKIPVNVSGSDGTP